MEVKRTIKMNTNIFKVRDIIKFKLTDGEKVKAMAVQETKNGMLFVFVDCIKKKYSIFNNYIESINENNISYDNSDLRKSLNGEILEKFPKEIRDNMLAVNSDGDMLRIPTEYEIFGKNVYGQEEIEKIEYWEPMKEKRNRIALYRHGKNGVWEWYWLINHCENRGFNFVNVSNCGYIDYCDASKLCGVRPVFCLKMYN